VIETVVGFTALGWAAVVTYSQGALKPYNI